MNEVELTFELERIIGEINDDFKEMLDDMLYEVMIGEVENIILKDVSIEVLSTPNELEGLTVITHRMGFNLAGERGQFLNVVSFHCSQISHCENDIYMPYDYKISYEDNEINIESQYEIEGTEKELLDFLHKVHYFEWFSNRYKDRLLDVLIQLGYEIPKD